MPKIKKVRVLPPKIKEIDDYPKLARASPSELESRFSEKEEDNSIPEENESLIESTQPILDSVAPKIRELPLILDPPQSTQTRQTSQPGETRNPDVSSKNREEENKIYSAISLSSAKQEIQKNYTQTSAWNQAPDPQFNPNRSRIGSSQSVHDQNSVGLHREQIKDRETTYSEIKPEFDKEKPRGRRPWEA